MVNNNFIKLLTKELSGALTEDEQHELNLLLQTHEEFRDQREILTDYWKRGELEFENSATLFKKVTDRIKAQENVAVESVEPSSKQLLFILRNCAAAAILLILGTVYYYQVFLKPNSSAMVVRWLYKTTRPASKSIITLSDGTVVTLNSATSLKYPDEFNGKIREVYLNGEAYFEVHKDHLHPFIIHTNKINIKVLGTSFNVKSYLNEPASETTLIRGSVEITLNDRPADRIVLKPKEKLIVQNTVATKKRSLLATDVPTKENAIKGLRYSLTNMTYFPHNEKLIVETSWLQNKLAFSDKDFTQLSVQLERWYGVHFEFVNNQAKKYRFTGLFTNESLPQALDALKMTEKFNYRISDSNVYIY